MKGRRGWDAGGAVAERKRGGGPAMGRYSPPTGASTRSQTARSWPQGSVGDGDRVAEQCGGARVGRIGCPVLERVRARVAVGGEREPGVLDVARPARPPRPRCRRTLHSRSSGRGVPNTKPISIAWGDPSFPSSQGDSQVNRYWNDSCSRAARASPRRMAGTRNTRSVSMAANRAAASAASPRPSRAER